MPEKLFDITYNGTFVCRTVEQLLPAFLKFLTEVLPFNGAETDVKVTAVKVEKAEEPAKAKKDA